MQLDERKREELEFHNRLRDKSLLEDPEAYAHLTSNKKFYSIVRASRSYVNNWLMQRCPRRRLLEYGCGDAKYSMLAARLGGSGVGIDISDVSVENSKTFAASEGLSRKTDFYVMDAEAMDFPENSFDLAIADGVLHHLDLAKAYSELSRVIKPGGAVICAEALAHNPLIHLYRTRTPHLRTKYETEHILRVSDLKKAKQYFNKVEVRFFHFFSLLAVPFRDKPYFPALLGALEKMDEVLLRIPGIRTWAWQMVFILSDPKKEGKHA